MIGIQSSKVYRIKRNVVNTSAHTQARQWALYMLCDLFMPQTEQMNGDDLSTLFSFLVLL